MKKDLTNVIGYIYKITSPNNKIYIGQTINKKQRRYHYNKGFYKGQIKLWNSTQKHNWNPSETFEVIEECLSGENKCFLNEREKYWVNYFDSFKNGLNCNEGGFGNTGYIASEETKNKISKYHKNKPPMSDETKEKLRQINLGKTYETKLIQQIDENGETIKIWGGITECAKALNLNISGISKVLTGKSKTTKGYKFKYNN